MKPGEIRIVEAGSMGGPTIAPPRKNARRP